MKYLACVGVAVLWGSCAFGQVACPLGWQPGGSVQGVAGDVFCGTLHDFDGDGPMPPQPVFGGDFSGAGATDALNIARWDGERWHEIGGGLEMEVRAVVSHDDGTGPTLFAAGRRIDGVFPGPATSVSEIRWWDGSEWLLLTDEVVGEDDAVGQFAALASGDLGNGPVLVVGGQFALIDGVEAKSVAVWDGATWSPLGDGLVESGGTPARLGFVAVLGFFDLGSGASLYAGGTFATGFGMPRVGVARWDDEAWEPLVGLTTLFDAVRDLAVFDDGNAAALYAVGNNFFVEGASGFQSAARWDGEGWTGLDIESSFGGLWSVVVGDVGRGRELLVSGLRSESPASGDLARLVGTSFEYVGLGVAGHTRILVAGASQDIVYAGGQVAPVEVVDISARQAGFNGVVGVSQGALVELGPGEGFDAFIADLLVPVTRPRQMFATGLFCRTPDGPARGVAVWDGFIWRPLGGGVDAGMGRVLHEHDFGDGPELVLGGGFAAVDNVPGTRGVARWTGSEWRALADGIDGDIRAIASGRLAGKDVLVIGGRFDSEGAQADFGHIAMWDDGEWVPVGGGVDGFVDDIEIFDDGSGPAMYVAALAEPDLGGPRGPVVRWDGTRWQQVGADPGVRAPDLFVFEGPQGRAMHARASAFEPAVRWDGSTWQETPFIGAAFFPTRLDGEPVLITIGGLATIVVWNSAGEATLPENGVWATPTRGAFTAEIYSTPAGPAVFAGGGFMRAGVVTPANPVPFGRGAVDFSVRPGVRSPYLARHGVPAECLPCSRADTTSTAGPAGIPDGVTDLADFTYYLDLWIAGASRADITATGQTDALHDGVVDLSDFCDFLNAWSRGCP